MDIPWLDRVFNYQNKKILYKNMATTSITYWEVDSKVSNPKVSQIPQNKEYNNPNASDSDIDKEDDPLIPDSEKGEDSIALPPNSEQELELDNDSLIRQIDSKPRPFITVDMIKLITTIVHFISDIKIKSNSKLSTLLDRLSTESFEHITVGLLKSSDRHENLIKQKLQARAVSSSGFKLCPKLKHFKQANPRQRGAGMLTESQILSFADRVFDMSHLPAGIPAEFSDMKLEENRLKSFSVKGLVAFKERYPDGQNPEKLAAFGMFYLQEADKVKCAFCLGALNCQSGDSSVQEAHRLRFATCPLLLGLDVGNVPIQKRQVYQEESTMEAEQCSDDSTSCHQAGCLDVSPNLPRCPELECGSQLALRPRLPVSASAAAAACRPGAADNLEILSRSLGSTENASRYHPMRFATFKDLHRRENSFCRSSQPVPSDLLAFAGFFLDSELKTTCYWCGLQVTNWLTSDNPWTEHARWSPRCCHLLLERGHDFVLLSRQVSPAYMPQLLRNHQLEKADPTEIMHEEASGSALSFVSGHNPLIDYRIEPRYFKAREDFPSTLAILQIGCEPADAKTAQFLQLKRAGDDFQSYEMFLHSVMTCGKERHSLKLTAQEYYEQVQRDQSVACSREPKPLSDDENFDWRGCKVCMDKVINVTLLDCKHLCCCSNCAKQLDSCPLCRTPIRATMLVNMD